MKCEMIQCGRWGEPMRWQEIYELVHNPHGARSAAVLENFAIDMISQSFVTNRANIAGRCRSHSTGVTHIIYELWYVEIDISVYRRFFL